MTYLKRPYLVTMGTFQMAVVLSFNNSPSLTIKELQETTQIPEKELIKQVQSLLESKLIVLASETKPESATKPESEALTETPETVSKPTSSAAQVGLH